MRGKDVRPKWQGILYYNVPLPLDSQRSQNVDYNLTQDIALWETIYGTSFSHRLEVTGL